MHHLKHAPASAASNGRLEISGESTAAFMSIRGYYVPEKWDVYWTIRSACHKAYESMQQGQLVNCIPGVQAMSLKRNFLQTWQQVRAEGQFVKCIVNCVSGVQAMSLLQFPADVAAGESRGACELHSELHSWGSGHVSKQQRPADVAAGGWAARSDRQPVH
jgi:hypothetical protein